MKLSANIFLTLDGVMQGPGAPDEDPSGGFERGGWLVPYADADFGGIVDGGLMRLTDYFLVIPLLPLMIVVADAWGPSLPHVIIVIGGLAWTMTAIVVRAQVRSIRERAYVKRAHALVNALQRSPRRPEVVCAPGNVGIAAHARVLEIDPVDLDAVVRRLDLVGIAQSVIDAIDLPEIMRESTGALSSDAVRAVREESRKADDRVTGLVDRLLRRSATSAPATP